MQVKFITTGANSAFGAFSTGDVLRCSPELARHLVEEVKCAEYLNEKQATPETKADPTAKPEQKQSKEKRGQKQKADEAGNP